MLLLEKAGLIALPFFFEPISCILAIGIKIHDTCLELSKIEALKNV
jgi:hypothetical protein